MATVEATDILMYHSISGGPPPLCTAPATFEAHMDELAAHGYRGVSLASYVRARAQPSGERVAVLTFDDGYLDFATDAAPTLAARGWGATVFVCSGLAGAASAELGGRRAGPFLDWAALREVAGAGFEIGAHGVTHADLTALPIDEALLEVEASGDEIAERLGCAVTSFAAPFGRSTAMVRRAVRRRYTAAVGTAMRRATRTDDVHNLPRIEMCYFGRRARWKEYLDGGGSGYAVGRRFLRAVRLAVTGRMDK